MKHLLSLADWSADHIRTAIAAAREVKAHPLAYANALHRQTLCMIFEKPSLRTRLSFETAMTQLGGHAIYYDASSSPLGAGKESLPDTIRVMSRYVDIIMARLFNHDHLLEMARVSSVPIINALTNFSHPGQVIADLQTIEEHLGSLPGRTLAYFGDAFNNVTHSLLFACPKLGISLTIACPHSAQPHPAVTANALACARKTGARLLITHNPQEAAKNADVLYTDSWMSYHIPHDQKEARLKLFQPYRVSSSLLRLAKPSAIFLNCLPAIRGMEQTADVIDGPQSVVFDQAENRLHVHKALLLLLLHKLKNFQL